MGLVVWMVSKRWFLKRYKIERWKEMEGEFEWESSMFKSLISEIVCNLFIYFVHRSGVHLFKKIKT